MDAVVVILVAFILWGMAKPALEGQTEVEQVQTVQLNPKLNDSFYHDETAFMVIANELGFH